MDFLFFCTITEISVDIKVTKKLKNCQDDILSILSMLRSSVLNMRRFEIELYYLSLQSSSLVM